MVVDITELVVHTLYMNNTIKESLEVEYVEMDKNYEEAVQEYRETLKENNKMRNGCNEAIDKQVNDAIIDSNILPDWNEFLAEQNKVNEYEGKYFMVYNEIRYLKTWLNGMDIGAKKKEVEIALENIEAMLCGLKGGYNFTEEDNKELLNVLKG